MTRSESRKQILGLVFEKSFHTDDIPEMIELAVEAREFKPNSFTIKSVEGIFENLEIIDEKISENCIGWKINRIPRVSLAIMRIAVYEMLFDSDMPIGVSINEAVELAKIYGGDDDPGYINGVLGAVSKTVEK